MMVAAALVFMRLRPRGEKLQRRPESIDEFPASWADHG
jgi:hypothetical protein